MPGTNLCAPSAKPLGQPARQSFDWIKCAVSSSEGAGQNRSAPLSEKICSHINLCGFMPSQALCATPMNDLMSILCSSAKARCP